MIHLLHRAQRMTGTRCFASVGITRTPDIDKDASWKSLDLAIRHALRAAKSA